MFYDTSNVNTQDTRSNTGVKTTKQDNNDGFMNSKALLIIWGDGGSLQSLKED